MMAQIALCLVSTATLGNARALSFATDGVSSTSGLTAGSENTGSVAQLGECEKKEAPQESYTCKTPPTPFWSPLTLSNGLSRSFAELVNGGICSYRRRGYVPFDEPTIVSPPGPRYCTEGEEDRAPDFLDVLPFLVRPSLDAQTQGRVGAASKTCRQHDFQAELKKVFSARCVKTLWNVDSIQNPHKPASALNAAAMFETPISTDNHSSTSSTITKVVAGSGGHGGEQGLARIWDAETGEILQILRGHQDRVVTAVFSKDGTKVLTGSWDSTAKIWDLRKKTQTAYVERLRCPPCVRRFVASDRHVVSAVFSPDEKTVLTASDRGSIKIWDVETGNCVRTLRNETTDVLNQAIFSSDGNMILSCQTNGIVQLWDATTGVCLNTLKAHKSSVKSVAFSEDGKFFLTGGNSDHTAKVWKLEDVLPSTTNTTPQEEEEEVAPMVILQGHSDVLTSVQFSKDGKKIVTASNDTTAKIWQTATGECLQTLAGPKGHSNNVMSAVFSKNGEKVLTSSRDGTTKIWQVELKSS